MDRKKEIKEIETILRVSEEFKKVDSSTILTYKKILFIWKNLGNINYFNFIPKTNTYNSKDFLELAVELKGIEKSFTIKNTILGISGLYFMFILDKQPKYFSFNTVGKFLFIGSLMFYKLLENQIVYLRIFNELYRPELINLKIKLEQENNGWEAELSDTLESIKTNIKELEDEKYEETNNVKHLKNEFGNIKYNQTEKSNILNLLSYTSEWLYSPVDEELENKLYFLDFKSNEDSGQGKLVRKIKNSPAPVNEYSRVEEYFQDQLENKLQEDLNNKSNISLSTMKKYGLLINEKI